LVATFTDRNILLLDIVSREMRMMNGISEKPLDRQAIDEEVRLMEHVLFLESSISHILKTHLPHLLYDDYITCPYVDWEKAAEQASEAYREEFLRQIQSDPPDVHMGRAMYPVLQGARAHTAPRRNPALIGITPRPAEAGPASEGDDTLSGRWVTSNTSPVTLHFADPSCLADKTLKATFIKKLDINHGFELTPTPDRGSFTLPAFNNNEQRNNFLGALLSLSSMEHFLHYLEIIVRDMPEGQLILS
jgi:hypothetical protein